MKRRCSICREWVQIDPIVNKQLFHERFEDGNILEAVVICDNCDDEIKQEGQLYD